MICAYLRKPRPLSRWVAREVGVLVLSEREAGALLVNGNEYFLM